MIKKKVLMLHGYVQSDKIFRAKTGGLRKPLSKLGYDFYFPCGPEHIGQKELKADDDTEDISKKYNTSNTGEDLYGWYKKVGSPTDITGDYEIKPDTIKYLHDYIVENGPFDGIIGFSQGSGVAGYLLTNFNEILGLTEEEQPEFKFFISFSGFRLEPERFQDSYNNSKIKTPTLLVKGELDTLVTEKRSDTLYEACDESSRTWLVHPGGHFVPSAKPIISQICNWVQAQGMDGSSSNIDTSLTKTKIETKASNSNIPDLDDDLLDMIDSMGKI
ncbi:hypothetical protein Kpol_413p12 [Vanderwaltozyma polyspora DSM 70294]|uniref:Serine hydrolase domain-containing protein n=1 Tax=Vanderwaltozyma polyspora (strain ATCC 22028 / DSM 70294 / BCRC 21397 / CBS 2163 / NBRC 10782 / NRRL Y-8283 / UCD 57-17) TaxID=436907 RepID=A7TRH7_VANPO|nr:uncharacterized protein Kpol_413p12 [Vanderwaltozyma polyspora DSM 70294]EDO15137.1 hypothetical protein Kpol_413p12 [Vanderwaltozyma polyspora DSM 70294]